MSAATSRAARRWPESTRSTRPWVHPPACRTSGKPFLTVIDIKHSPGRVRLILDAPHGNAITDAMVASLRAALRSIAPPVKLVTIEGAGGDFSFGASIDEHTPERMRDVLPRFHALIVELLRVPAVTAAAVSGRCLG